MLEDVLRPGPRNYGAVLAAAVAVAIALNPSTNPGVRYGAWLALFTVWMFWFVLTGVIVLRGR